MKLTTIIMTLLLIQVSAATRAQITLSEKNAPLSKVIEALRKQSGYDFFYNDNSVKKAKPVTVRMTNATLNEALEVCFKGQALTYIIENNTVVIKESKPNFLDNLVARFQAIDIRARVTDEKGLPLPGASVRVKNSNQAAVTDANGFFNLKAVADDAILMISFIGYNQKEVKVSADLGLIRLETASSKLDEVQVMAYGTTSRRLSTSNIISVKAADIEKQPVTNPLLALQGRVPGLDINQSTGYANTGVKVRIQGESSITKGNDPLYVIDGVPYPAQMLRGASGILGQSGAPIGKDALPQGDGNPMSFINPASIESIEVLKDADATAIYGSRAAGGAILITTKRGKAGETRTDIIVQTGGAQTSRKLDMLNTEQYLAMRKEGYKNNGVAAPTSATVPSPFNYDLTVWDQNRYTDWQSELIGGTAMYTDAQATVSGGTANTQFLIGAGYHKETTVFPADFGNSKSSVNFSLNSASANQKFRFQLTGGFMYDYNDVPDHNLAIDALRISPNAPALYNPDGSLNWAPYTNPLTGVTVSTWKNPLAFMETTYNVKTDNLRGTGLLSYQLFPGLDIKSTFGYTTIGTDEFVGTPSTFYAPETRGSNKNGSVFLNTKLNSWVIEPQVTYKRVLDRGTLDVLLGGTLQQNATDLKQLAGVDFSSDLLLHDFSSMAEIRGKYSTTTKYRYNAIFGRLGYNLLDKYLINLTARRDGSSRFGPENQFHNFTSIAGAWIFSAEEMIKNQLPFVSFGKLRASYGTTGNDQIGDYQFLNEYANPLGIPAYQGIIGIAPTSIPNPDLAWEDTRKLQGGIDLGFFNDRILLNVNYYQNRSSNQLLGYNLPLVTGFSFIPVVNFPATVQNYGWEFMLNTINVKSNNFTWTTNINLTSPKNKLIRFDNLETSAYANVLFVGQPITINRAFKYLGVDPATGLYQVADKNGNPATSVTPDDYTQVIDRSPKIRGGFHNSFIYSGLQLDIMFQFAKQLGPSYRGDRPGFMASSTDGLVGGNQPASVLDRWQNPGDIKTYQKFSAYTQPRGTSGLATFNAYQNVGGTSWAFEDASYIRLKNVSLSWTLPDEWIKPVHLKNTRLFIQGQNLLTFTKYNGLDPESPANVSLLPSLRVLTFGIKVGL